MSYSFPHRGFLEDDIWSTLTIESLYYKTKTLGLPQSSTNIGNCILWCFSLFFPLGVKKFCLVYRNYLGFFPHDFLKIIPTFFLKDFWGSYILYCIFWFFSHRVFKELFDWLQDHEKIKLITGPQENENWSRGSVTKKLELVINFCNS